MRELLKLVCTECGSENYHTTKNKKEHPERMEVKKYCPKLRKYTCLLYTSPSPRD